MPELVLAESIRLAVRKRIAAAKARALFGAGAAVLLVAAFLLRVLRRYARDHQRRSLPGVQARGAQRWSLNGSSWDRTKSGGAPRSATANSWAGSWSRNHTGSWDSQEYQGQQCWICKKPLNASTKNWKGNEEYRLNMRVRCCAGNSPQLCHFQCIQGVLQDSNVDAHPEIDPNFKMELQEVLEEFWFSPSKAPNMQYSFEEMQLVKAGKQKLPVWPQPYPAAPPAAAFAFSGLTELRISACPLFRTLPPEVGLCRSLRMLVFISTGLTEIPVEVSELKDLHSLYLNGNYLQSLPNAVGALPRLQEICLDANQLTVIPAITSPELTMFSAPANQLKEVPMLSSSKLERLEVHGNQLHALPLSRMTTTQVSWSRVLKLKLMGNHIQELPKELGSMRSLRQLMVASNCLTTLPRSVASLRRLEWLFAYGNQLRELPPSLLLGSGWLERVLLEGNPLSVATTAALINDVPRSCVRTLGLDATQIRKCEEGVTGWEVLPPSISVGNVVQADTAGHYYMKLTRASQLRRKHGMPALGEPDGPALPEDVPARLLVVAFAASQAEPEWLGALQRLATAGRAPGRREVLGSLRDFVGEGSAANARLVSLWSGCARNDDDTAGESPEVSTAPLEDFDVLSVVDHRMRWYSEDAETFSRALAAVAKPYERTLFVGASMGGFGAMRHCAHIASAVLVFGPQALLSTATLRPPASDFEAHEVLRNQMLDSLRTARSRGISVEVHCAADEHLGHALSLPLGDLGLTVHPLCPRKPFAKLLERVGLLTPIVAEVVSRILPQPGTSEDLNRPAQSPDLDSPRVAVARWLLRRDGKCKMERYWAAKTEMLPFFFSRHPPRSLPRPGDWFCPKCSGRNMSWTFWCINCKDTTKRALVSDAGVMRIPDGQQYPKPGDWGCGKCGNACCSYHASCTHCHTSRDDPSAILAISGG
mmetsp:Transcript_147533/g.271132  ORF Transcript_147533/g.271132 Transcript_147533/m.271132 type:complete len:935 (+) Transcript_147533:74-2878(+)